jgi:hypothetical protein
MPLLGNSKQNKTRTLEDFYLDFTKDKSNPVWEKIGRNMLAFIDLVNQTFPETKIWGLTSHSNLVLQTQDKWDSDWYVTVNCIGSNEYYFEYRLPKDKSPWEYATVKGVAKDFSEAKKYLLIAMKESEGWKDNNELKKLLLEYGIA